MHSIKKNKALKILKKVLGITCKKVLNYNYEINTEVLMVKRLQLAQLLEQKLKAGYRVINYDESSLSHSKF